MNSWIIRFLFFVGTLTAMACKSTSGARSGLQNTLPPQAETIVRCTAEQQGAPHALILRINSSGTIEPWDDEHYAQVESGPLFQIFGQGRGEFEGDNSFLGDNGYAILQLVTTADDVKVGVSADRTRGFYDYRDIGSGAGNSRFDLACAPLGGAPAAAQAAVPPASKDTVVRCAGNHQGKPHALRLRISGAGLIEPWDDEHYAQVESGPLFQIFGYGPRSEFEGDNSFLGDNGYAILQLITTADDVKVGVSADRTKGFFAYRDIGSGAGNTRFDLACALAK